VNRKSKALITALVITGLAYLLLYLGVLPSLLQMLLGVFVVIMLPGYLLSEIFFPFLRNTQRLTLSLGLSMVLVILFGFGLHLAGFGLVKEMWLAVSFYTVLVLGIVALFRTTQQEDILADARPVPMPKLHEPLLVLVAVCIAGVALSMSSGSSQRQNTPITQLWMLPRSSDTASNDTVSSDTVQVGVVSNEIETFRLVIMGDGKELLNQRIVTPDSQAQVIPFVPKASYRVLSATLYLPGSDIPYRRVVLW
jgi:uncharacterized membrane protein